MSYEPYNPSFVERLKNTLDVEETQQIVEEMVNYANGDVLKLLVMQVDIFGSLESTKAFFVAGILHGTVAKLTVRE